MKEKEMKFIKPGNKTRVEIYFSELKNVSKYKKKNETLEMSQQIILNFRN